ncbi:SDH family Clp fold serine proteinase [Sorangium sp. So ce1153]|uniref:SDH family Clp fold serine proteinase n=1 Tax=Sorangium sp. So ce1153 TaxID=3133333 RepID=UPI003F61A7BE
MGVYSEYLSRGLDFRGVEAERKAQLQRIAQLRGGRDVLVIAADISKSTAPIAIDYSDLLPTNDQLSNLGGKDIDIILETPGGSGPVVEDIVRLVRGRYASMAVVVPGWAKSAGTIMAMAADEILMEPVSALGPIDAQITWQGKQFSAEALIEGVKKIKEETASLGQLNKAYIPILQGISPGELENANNALEFAKILVEQWLADYKFRAWTRHSSSGREVTSQERRARAREIAERLCNHKDWRTHSRSIKIDDLRAMRLLITDYSTVPELADAIRRYHALLQVTFSFGVYKLFETSSSQIYRIQAEQPAVAKPAAGNVAVMDVTCGRCGAVTKLQANLGVPSPLRPGLIAFPADNKFECGSCKAVTDLSAQRAEIESQLGKRVVA